MIAALIGAGVGLLAGAGLGVLLTALSANARVEAAQADAERWFARAEELQLRCNRYVGELDALVEATRPPAEEVWTDSGSGLLVNSVIQGHPETCQVHIGGRCNCEVGEEIRARRAAIRRSFDANPTVLLAPGQTYEQWYAAYADDLDRRWPGWWEDLSGAVAPELVRLAEQRQHETYEQNELDQDRIPNREDFQAAEARHRLRSSATSPHRPGMAIYPRHSKED